MKNFYMIDTEKVKDRIAKRCCTLRYVARKIGLKEEELYSWLYERGRVVEMPRTIVKPLTELLRIKDIAIIEVPVEERSFTMDPSPCRQCSLSDHGCRCGKWEDWFKVEWRNIQRLFGVEPQ